MRTVVSVLLTVPLLLLALWLPSSEASVIGPSDFLVPHLESVGDDGEYGRVGKMDGLDGGRSLRWDRESDAKERGRGRHGETQDGRFTRAVDRLLSQPGTLQLGQYQSEIVPTVTERHTNYSLFTSGIKGVSAPSATIVGSSITVDLSSLYFVIDRGDSLSMRNIGGIATGTFDQDTQEFSLTWDHLFGDHHRGGPVTFSLQGKVITGVSTAPVPLVNTAVLFATGLMMLMGLWLQRGMGRRGRAIPVA
jgi:hypothetical protein